MPKRTSAKGGSPLRFVIVTLDGHLARAAREAGESLSGRIPGLELRLHAAAEFSADQAALDACLNDIATADILLVTQLFMEEHLRPVLPALQARQPHCYAVAACMSAPEVVRLTRLGKFTMDGATSGPLAFLKKLRNRSKEGRGGSGAREMAMLRRLPKILKYVPGTAQDVRAYFLTLQYWLAGSQENMANLVRFLVNRYADGAHASHRGVDHVPLPAEYPDVGLYHPGAKRRISDHPKHLPAGPKNAVGTVGLVLMRSYPLAENAAHYDGVIAALEHRGLKVLPVFASGLDARPAIDAYFRHNGRTTVDAIVSLTGFPLVGGPAYNDAQAAEDLLAELDVPYIGATPLEFQTLEEWDSGERGLTPVEATMMVAIPELEGATGSIVFGGRSSAGAGAAAQDMAVHEERAGTLAERVARLVKLRKTATAERRLAVVLFNFPPNSGATGTAAYLSVFESLRNVLLGLRADGYDVEVPDSADALREAVVGGNAQLLGTDANVAARVAVDEHVRRERWLDDIENQWGPAPGRDLTDGRSLFVLGAHFGNVFVGVQPAFGYEGDPMRLLFERGFAPTHAFCNFYRYLREDFGADAVLHFGTHGALEFMPGKQAGMSQACWPDRLIGALPNFYFYAANNPSEGAIARRRSAATLISYLTPAVTRAGVYRELDELKIALERWRALPPDEDQQRRELAEMIAKLCTELDFDDDAAPADDAAMSALWERVLEREGALIPEGLHVIGQRPAQQKQVELLEEMAKASFGVALPAAASAAIAEGRDIEDVLKLVSPSASEDVRKAVEGLSRVRRCLNEDREIPALIRALNGGFVRPAPGGDLLRNPDILPTGRNVHGFDPFKIPSAFAIRDGARHVEQILARHSGDGHALPNAVAMVLWATDNLKSEGAPVGQALALMGARPAFDTYGRLTGAQLIPLAELGRPRIDVVITLSGMFRDLLPLQIRVLAQAAYLAATADEPTDCNFVRKRTLALCETHGMDEATAALRVFSNADGAYGSNVNMLIDSGAWNDEDELGDTFLKRKGYGYDHEGNVSERHELLTLLLSDIDLAYQNLESVELGVTTVDHYFDSLGGIHRVAQQRRDDDVPVYISDQTVGAGAIRTLKEQVTLESHTRILNPKWYESMLEHGYEGVRHIECHLTNTVGWSATTGQVAPAVYQRIAQTFMLDDSMRERLASLNPVASARVANRLLEAGERNYWSPDEETLAALRNAGEELEDRLEGLDVGVAA